MATLKTTLQKRILRLIVLKLLIQIAIHETVCKALQHDGTEQLDQGNHERTISDRTQMVAHNAHKSLDDGGDTDILLSMRMKLQTYRITLVEIPLTDSTGNGHGANGINETRRPEPDEQMPEGKNEICACAASCSLGDERAVGHGIIILTEHVGSIGS